MRRTLLSVVCLLLGTPMLFGQPTFLPPPRITTLPAEITPMRESVAPVNFNEPSQDTPRWSLTAEYLLWSTSRSPVPVPLVTTGDTSRTAGGFIGDQSTRVLVGNSNIDFGGISGGRIGLTRWLDCDRVLGIEGSAFVLGRQETSNLTASDAAGSPLLVFPYQTPAGVETGLVISDPNPKARGNVRVNISNRFWGADANGVYNIYQQQWLAVDALLGFRYFDLGDSLEIVSNSENPITLKNYSAVETFRTRNQFFGGQLGSRVGLQQGRVSADFTSFIALGSTEQVVSIVGTSNFSGANATPAGTRSGFLYTQQSNIGNRRHRAFSAIPQMQAKLGFDLTCKLRATVGYDAIWWNNVVRPGDQIDRVINITQASPNIGGIGVLSGAARPAPLNTTSDFWAQGVSFGLEYRW